MNRTKIEEISKACISSEAILYYEKLLVALDNNEITIEEYFLYLKENKQLLTIYGNCQAAYILKMLSHTDVIKDNFIFLSFRGVHTMKSGNYNMNKLMKCLQFVDIFIYQYVKLDNIFGEEYATDNILSCLKKDCKKICIPNVFFKGYFPHYVHNRKVVFWDERKTISLEPIDSKINFFVDNNFSEKQMIAKLEDKSLFSKEDLEKNVRNSLAELVKREEKCDIRISDYIKAYYKKKYLFYTPNHPTNIVQKELTCHILRKLGYKKFSIDMNGITENDHVEMFIYPSIVCNLDLEFKKNTFRFCKYVDLQYDNLESYVNKYRRWLFMTQKDLEKQENWGEVVQYESKYVDKRRDTVLEIRNGWVHLSLYLNINYVGKINGTMLRMPQIFAPQNTFVTHGIMIESKIAVCTITSNGEIKLNIDNADGTARVCIIDTNYIAKMKNS